MSSRRRGLRLGGLAPRRSFPPLAGRVGPAEPTAWIIGAAAGAGIGPPYRIRGGGFVRVEGGLRAGRFAALGDARDARPDLVGEQPRLDLEQRVAVAAGDPDVVEVAERLVEDHGQAAAERGDAADRVAGGHADLVGAGLADLGDVE